MSTACDIDAAAVTVLSSILGAIIAQGLTPEEQNFWGNIIIQVGQTIVTIAAASE